jgi:undecaprenyl diphosphate synthase
MDSVQHTDSSTASSKNASAGSVSESVQGDGTPSPPAEPTGSGDADVAADVRELWERGELPAHLACIMDGNGRWAQNRDKARFVGHHEGVSSVRTITEACAEVGVEYLTLYTFSTENWNRPQVEVNALMELLIHTVEEERETLMKNDVRLRTIGDLSELPDECQAALDRTKKLTAGNERMTLTLALSYSGRWEILNAVREIAEEVRAGRLDPDQIDEALFVRHLDTAGMPDPDLLIRTGGEYRLSNFLLWQSAYTELYITERYWPDFRREQLLDAIRSYQDRDRRFGRVEEAED